MDCATVVAAVEVCVEVTLATNGPEGDRLVKESVAELKVVLRGIAEPVPILAAVPTELVMFIEPVAVAFDDDIVEYAIRDDPVPPTRENRPE